jgi:hypothetical protein
MAVHSHPHVVPGAIEEVCACGHYRSQHLHLHLKSGRKSYRREGYGACTMHGCKCPRFQWERTEQLPVTPAGERSDTPQR